MADAANCVGKVTNLATGVGVTVGELVERILRIVGRKLPVVETEERKRPEASEVFEPAGLGGAGPRAGRLAGERRRWTRGCGRRSSGSAAHLDVISSVGAYRI